MRRVVLLVVTAMVLAACTGTHPPNSPAAASSSTLGADGPSGEDKPAAAQGAAPPGGQPYCEKTPCVPASLWRPLKIPHIGPGQPCPVSPLRKPNPRVYGAGRGIGPVYAAFGRGPLSVLLPPPQISEFAGSDWGGNKVLWYAGPRVIGPLLIRGHQLDCRRPTRDPVRAGHSPAVHAPATEGPAGRLARLAVIHQSPRTRLLWLATRRAVVHRADHLPGGRGESLVQPIHRY
jgi:hypothetical protein